MKTLADSNDAGGKPRTEQDGGLFPPHFLTALALWLILTSSFIMNELLHGNSLASRPPPILPPTSSPPVDRRPATHHSSSHIVVVVVLLLADDSVCVRLGLTTLSNLYTYLNSGIPSLKVFLPTPYHAVFPPYVQFIWKGQRIRRISGPATNFKNSPAESGKDGVAVRREALRASLLIIETCDLMMATI